MTDVKRERQHIDSKSFFNSDTEFLSVDYEEHAMPAGYYMAREVESSK